LAFGTQRSTLKENKIEIKTKVSEKKHIIFSATIGKKQTFVILTVQNYYYRLLQGT
jgi:hypothetical protein